MMMCPVTKVFFVSCVIALILSVANATTSDEDTHDHEEHESWEIASVYTLDSGDYAAMITPTDGGEFTDDSFAFMVFNTSSADEGGLEEAEEIAEPVWEAYTEEAEAEEVHPGDVVIPSNVKVYSVHLDSNPSEVSIDISGGGAYVFFLEHGEEEMSFQVANPAGSVVDAVLTETADEHEGEDEGEDDHDHDHDGEDEEDESSVATGTQWVNAIGASLVISVCSLVGIIFTVSPAIAKAVDLSHACLVAAGALLTTTFLHIIPEGIEGLDSEYDDSHTLGNRMGLALLCGMLFGVIVHAALSAGHASHNSSHDGHSSEPGSSRANLHTVIQNGRGRRLMDLHGLHPVCWNVIVGDLVHNFADGVLIGVAFLSCSLTLGWIVTASTVLHEVPHEIADFMALMHSGMSLAQSYLFNFLSALSAVAGVVLILAMRGEMTAAETAFLLLFGGGSFVFIALAELIPEALATGKGGAPTWDLQLRKILWFIAGGLLIGIPLIWDRHCEDAHGHHDH